MLFHVITSFIHVRSTILFHHVFIIYTTDVCISLLLLVWLPFCIIFTIAPIGSFNSFLIYGVSTYVLGETIYCMWQIYTYSSSIIRQSVQKYRSFPRYTYTTNVFSKIYWLLILISSHWTPQIPVKVDQGLFNYQCK